MPVLSRLLLLFLPVLACVPVAAQETGTPPATIKVFTRKNPGDLEYRWFISAQRRLLSTLPPEPRRLDLMHRISFTELPQAQRDAYLPKSWGVSVVGKTVDQEVEVRRGGYFLIPENTVAYDEDAAVMFKEQSRRKLVETGWIVRPDPGQRLRYADFAQALKESKAVQKKISLFDMSLRIEKYTRLDTLKACFLEAGGQLLIGGKPAADAAVGNCALLKFDPARAAGSEEIEFAGPLDIVTLVESRDYASSLAPAG